MAKTIRISSVDKSLIRAYVKWHFKKYGFFPTEHFCSCLIDNVFCDHRQLVDDFLFELRLQLDSNEL